ncbi:MAG: hypothetical protein ABIT04_01640 [Novosphingobium sp.]
MADDFERLKEACYACTPIKEAERIGQGESRWFAGYPDPSSRGTVSLLQPTGFRLTFREEDVLEAKRHNKLFLVRVSSEANLSVSMSQVVKAGSAGRCDCGDDEKSGERLIDITAPWGDWGDKVIVLPWGGCHLGWNCGTIDLPIVGPIYLCIPSRVYCV